MSDPNEGASCPIDPVAATSVHAPWANAPGGLEPISRHHEPTEEQRRMVGDGMTVTGVAPWASGVGGTPSGSLHKPRGPVTAAYNYDLNSTDKEENDTDWTQVEYCVPDKVILDETDMKIFQSSTFYKNYMIFLRDLNRSVVGHAATDKFAKSPFISSVLEYLAQLSTWIDEIPPIDQPMRFGNKAFRTWHEKLSTEDAVKSWLPDELKQASIEIAPYFCDAFGNATRIDYGTGHETNFMVGMYALYRIGVLRRTDFTSLVLNLFSAYITLSHKLQRTYWLEPAGSHGAWSLDDYQFLPFFFGSAQLIGHPMIKPKSVTNEDVLNGYSTDYLYLDAVKFVLTYKKGPFGEVAPILYSLTNIPGWRKLNSGMAKMYQGEVLSKVPIMQHLLFGRIIEFPQ